MTALQERLLIAFDSEYQTVLESIRSNLTRVESSGEPLTGPALDEVFRMAHTLKGSARVVEFHNIVALAHRMETLFSKIREGTISWEGISIRVLFSVLDAIEDIVSAFKRGMATPETQPILNALDTQLEVGSSSAVAPLVQEPKLTVVPPLAPLTAPPISNPPETTPAVLPAAAPESKAPIQDLSPAKTSQAAPTLSPQTSPVESEM
ncbi:MAG: hypothetical protein EOP09_04415, partial [Proteobacteria bacterium]